MLRLSATVQPYAWGSRTAIPELLGRQPDGSPQAEAWWGAHPLGPSRVAVDQGEIGLDDAIAADPIGLLGEQVAARFDAQLPFLLKVLAVDAPLSLQVHPTKGQARLGYILEEMARVPARDPARRYPDAHHKPELVVAVTPFHALAGFRTHADIAALLAELACPELDRVFAAVKAHASAAAVRVSVSTALTLVERARRELVDALTEALDRRLARPAPVGLLDDLTLLRRLAEAYPGDSGVAVAALLQPLRLAAGEALFVPPGVLHAYMSGVCVEVQASSDNVLRGGLTPKFVDVPSLLDALDVRQHTSRVPAVVAGSGELRYDPPVEEFRVSRHDVAATAWVRVSGPQILLCMSGSVEVTESDDPSPARAGASSQRPSTDARLPVADLARPAPVGVSRGMILGRGQAVFVAGSVAALRLSGLGIVFRAGTNLRPRAATQSGAQPAPPPKEET